jgi:hypothetical protein
MWHHEINTVLLALILPVTAVALIGLLELIAKDPVEETPDWVRPCPPAHKRHPFWRRSI